MINNALSDQHLDSRINNKANSTQTAQGTHVTISRRLVVTQTSGKPNNNNNNISKSISE